MCRIRFWTPPELFFNDIDINRGPLYYDEGEDFVTYSQIKTLMNNQNYIEAVKLIDETLIGYPKTIFAKDLLLFRLRALESFDSVENSDMIVDMGTKWIKKYPTDVVTGQLDGSSSLIETTQSFLFIWINSL